jgi:hypothetical protein
MRLHVGKATAEQLLGPLDRQRLDRIRRRAALIVATPRIAFRIFVGKHGALRLEHGAAHDVLRSDQLDLVALPVEFAADRGGDIRIDMFKIVSEEAAIAH